MNSILNLISSTNDKNTTISSDQMECFKTMQISYTFQNIETCYIYF